MVSFRNQLFHSPIGDDLGRTLSWIDDSLKRLGVTYVPSGTDCVGMETDDSTLPRTRWNADLQRMEVWAYKAHHSYRDDPSSDGGILFRTLSSVKGGLGPLTLLALEREARRKTNGGFTSHDVDVDGRPVATSLYYRWLAVG